MGGIRCSSSLVVVVVLLLVVRTVEGYPSEDLIDRLPGQPPVKFKQYSGYVDIDTCAGRSLFYYFVEAYNDCQNKPLTLWLNGGPGCSSVGGGAFTELGPFLPREDGRSLRLNHWSWNHVSNMLFVEFPAGVGWSYSNRTSDYTLGDTKAADDMLHFLLGWFEKFPEYKSRDFFLAGESYAGHYIPQLATVLLNYNKMSSDFKFKVKSLALGNPLLNLRRDTPSTFLFFWSHGMDSDDNGVKFKKECNFSGYIKSKGMENNLTDACEESMDGAYQNVGPYIDPYDVVADVCYPEITQQMLRLNKIVKKKSMDMDVCMKEETTFYLNLPQVQKALHSNRTNLPYKWAICDDHRLNYSTSDEDLNMILLLKELIQSGLPIWIYSGDQDSTISLIGTRRNVRDLANSLNFNITLPYRAWVHKHQVGGWTTEYGNLLTYATVRAGSHMVAMSQPKRALALFDAFIRGKRLESTTSMESRKS